MNDALKLQISAFIDGELPDNETELLLRRLSQDADLRAQVAHYLTIGRAIRGELEFSVMNKLRGRIAAALGEDIAEVERVPQRESNWFMRPIVGVAVAASVAVMALVGLRQVGPGEEIPNAGFSDLAALAIEEAPGYTEPPADEFLSDRPSERMQAYFRYHNARSSDLNSRLVSVSLLEDQLVSSEADDQADDAALGSETGDRKPPQLETAPSRPVE